MALYLKKKKIRLSTKKRFNIGKAVAALCLVLAFLMPGPASAQKFLENYKIPMPEIAPIPQQDFEAQSSLYEDTPSGDKRLQYQLRVPKDWQRQEDVAVSSSTVGTKILGDLSKFYGPSHVDLRSYMTVQAMTLDYKLTAEQWFLQWILANNNTLQGIKTHNDRRVEAMYVYIHGDITYMVRAVAQINGKHVMMVQYFLPQQYLEEEKALQAAVVGSFKLPNVIDEFVETMEKYHFLDLAEVKYPTTWNLIAKPASSVDRLSIQMLSVASEEQIKQKKYKRLNGKMEMELVSYYSVDSLKDELKNYKRKIAESGLVVQNFIENVKDFKLHKDLSAKAVEVYKVRDTENEVMSYEFWLLVMEAGDYYYFLSLLTPSRDEDFFVWSRNTQTFRVVASTIVPRADSLLKD